MNFDKIMRNYYQQKLNEINGLEPVMVQRPAQPLSKATWLNFAWDEVLGWLVMTGTILHYFFTGRLFELFQFIPGFINIF